MSKRKQKGKKNCLWLLLHISQVLIKLFCILPSSICINRVYDCSISCQESVSSQNNHFKCFFFLIWVTWVFFFLPWYLFYNWTPGIVNSVTFVTVHFYTKMFLVIILFFLMLFEKVWSWDLFLRFVGLSVHLFFSNFILELIVLTWFSPLCSPITNSSCLFSIPDLFSINV